jgi:hypothetical protein
LSARLDAILQSAVPFFSVMDTGRAEPTAMPDVCEKALSTTCASAKYIPEITLGKQEGMKSFRRRVQAMTEG